MREAPATKNRFEDEDVRQMRAGRRVYTERPVSGRHPVVPTGGAWIRATPVSTAKQCALRAAVLEPPMLAAVNLHQFADAFAAIARLVDGLSPLLAIEPQPGFDHPGQK